MIDGADDAGPPRRRGRGAPGRGPGRAGRAGRRRGARRSCGGRCGRRRRRRRGWRGGALRARPRAEAETRGNAITAWKRTSARSSERARRSRSVARSVAHLAQRGDGHLADQRRRRPRPRRAAPGAPATAPASASAVAATARTEPASSWRSAFCKARITRSRSAPPGASGVGVADEIAHRGGRAPPACRRSRSRKAASSVRGSGGARNMTARRLARRRPCFPCRGFGGRSPSFGGFGGRAPIVRRVWGQSPHRSADVSRRRACTASRARRRPWGSPCWSRSRRPEAGTCRPRRCR